jgi:hypothetical protein
MLATVVQIGSNRFEPVLSVALLAWTLNWTNITAAKPEPNRTRTSGSVHRFWFRTKFLNWTLASLIQIDPTRSWHSWVATVSLPHHDTWPVALASYHRYYSVVSKCWNYHRGVITMLRTACCLRVSALVPVHIDVSMAILWYCVERNIHLAQNTFMIHLLWCVLAIQCHNVALFSLVLSLLA